MLDRLPTLPGLPSVGPPPDALTSDISTNYIHQNNNKSWRELPEDPLSASRGGIPTPGVRPEEPLLIGGGGVA